MADDRVEIVYGARFDEAVAGAKAVGDSLGQVGARVGELRGQLAMAKADLQGFSSWAKQASEAMRSEGPLAQSAANLGVYREGMLALANAESRVKQIQGELNEVTRAGGSIFQNMSSNLPTATREVRALFDELSSGRTRMVPGTLAILAQRVLGLGPAALIAGAGVVGLVGGLAYLVYRSVEADRAIEHLQEQFALTGRGASITSGYLRAVVGDLSDVERGSRATAMAILEEEAAHARMSVTTMEQIEQVAPRFIEAYGDKAPAAMRKLIAAISDLTESGFRKLDAELLNLSPAEYEVIEGLIRAGKMAEAVTAIFARLNGAPLNDIKGQIVGLEKELAAAKELAQELQNAAGMDMLGTNTAAWVAAQMARIKDLEDRLATLKHELASGGAQDKSNVYKLQRDDVDKTNESLRERAGILARIDEYQRGLGTAKSMGDAAGIAAFTSGIATETKKLADFNKRVAEADFRSFESAERQKLEAAKTGSAARIAVLQEELAKARALGLTDEANRIKGEIAQNQREGAQEGARATYQAMEQQLRDIGEVTARYAAGSAQRIAADKTWLQAATAAGTEYREQQRAAQRALDDDLRAAAQQKTEIQRQDANAAIEIDKIKLQSARDELEAEVAQGKIGAAQRFAQLRELATEENALDRQRLEDELATLQQGTAAYDRVFNEILVLQARFQATMAQLERQGAMERRKEIEQEAQAWRGVVREIDSAEQGMIRNLLTRRESFGQAAAQLAERLVENEIAADLKWLTNKILIDALGLQSERVTGQEGVLEHLLTESAKTTATTAGVTARTSVETAGASTSLAAQIGAALKSIAVDAGQTFGGIFAFLAPLMGPAAVGPATAGAATVEGAIGSIASFDVGAWNMPQDMMGVLHAGETVVPESFASGMRAAVSGGGNGGGGGEGGAAATAAPGINLTLQVNSLNAKDTIAHLSNPTILRAVAARLGGYLAANPSVRGNY